MIFREIVLIDRNLKHFINGLEESTIAKVFRTIDLLGQVEYKLGMPHCKKIEINLFELRIRGKQEIRIFYTFKQDRVILLHGFIKKSEKIPFKELHWSRQKLALLDTI